MVINNIPTSYKILLRYVDDFQDSQEENTVREYLILFITSDSNE